MVDKDTTTISGLRKSAILMLSLDREVAARVMRLLDHDVVEDISREIAGVEELDSSQRDSIVEEFYNMAMAQQYAADGGLGYARKLLEQSLSKDDAFRCTSAHIRPLYPSRYRHSHISDRCKIHELCRYCLSSHSCWTNWHRMSKLYAVGR